MPCKTCCKSNWPKKIVHVTVHMQHNSYILIPMWNVHFTHHHLSMCNWCMWHMARYCLSNLWHLWQWLSESHNVDVMFIKILQTIHQWYIRSAREWKRTETLFSSYIKTPLPMNRWLRVTPLWAQQRTYFFKYINKWSHRNVYLFPNMPGAHALGSWYV